MEVYSVKPKKLAKLQKEFGKLPSNGMKHEKKKNTESVKHGLTV